MQVENRNNNKSAGNVAPSAPKKERNELKDQKEKAATKKRNLVSSSDREERKL